MSEPNVRNKIGKTSLLEHQLTSGRELALSLSKGRGKFFIDWGRQI
jgi:hypothetical protein